MTSPPKSPPAPAAEVFTAPVNVRKIQIVPLLFLLLAAALARAALINQPFIPNEEGTATGIPVCAAVNYARYGPFASRFAGVLNWGEVPQELWTPYTHHPPLVPLLISAAIRVFGTDEWSIRLIPAIFSVASTALVFLIVARRFGSRPALLAGIFYALAPITLAFGGMPDYISAQVVFFCLAYIECYLRWFESRRRKWLVLLTLCFIFGALSDWPIFYLPPLLGIHALLSLGRRAIPPLVGFAIATVAIFTALVLWSDWAGGDVSIFHQLRVRAFGETDKYKQPINLTFWFTRVFLGNLGTLHGWIILAPAIAYTLWLLKCTLSARDKLQQHAGPLLVLLLAILHLLIAVQGNSQHKWWTILVTPGLAIAAAVAIELFITRFSPGRRWLNVTFPAAVAIIFIVISVPIGYRELTTPFPHARNVPYSAKDLGRVIQSVAAPTEGVLTSDRVWEPPMWFYADRQLRAVVDTPELLQKNLGPGIYHLCYNYLQNDGPAPRWFVLPGAHRTTLPELTAVLDARFPRRAEGEFFIYDLKSETTMH